MNTNSQIYNLWINIQTEIRKSKIKLWSFAVTANTAFENFIASTSFSNRVHGHPRMRIDSPKNLDNANIFFSINSNNFFQLNQTYYSRLLLKKNNVTVILNIHFPVVCAKAFFFHKKIRLCQFFYGWIG